MSSVAVGATVAGGRESITVSGGDGGDGFVSSVGPDGPVPPPGAGAPPEPGDEDTGGGTVWPGADEGEGEPAAARRLAASRAFLTQRCSAVRPFFPLPVWLRLQFLVWALLGAVDPAAGAEGMRNAREARR